MSPANLLAEAFASPLSSDTQILSALVAGKWLARERDRLIEGLQQHDLTAFADALAAFAATGERARRPGIGRAARVARQGHWSFAALQFACAAPIGPAQVTLQMDIASAHELFVDGWLVPVHGRVHLERDAHGLVLASGGVEAHFVADAWSLRPEGAPPPASWVVHPLAIGGPHYLVESELRSTAGIFPWNADAVRQRTLAAAPNRAGAPGIADTTPFDRWPIAATMALLRRTAPAYADWVSAVTDGCLLIEGDANNGTSSAELPGLVALTTQTSLVRCAETLLAQASQQYLSLCLLATPLAEESREEIHYSASRRSYLTTRRLLAGAHEHANAQLMLDAMAVEPQVAEEARARAQLRRLMLAVESQPLLNRSRGLSTAGQAMWQVLCRQAGL